MQYDQVSPYCSVSCIVVLLLFRQIKTDSEFLKSQRIMDYSLLLGVHYRAPQHLRTRASYRRTMTAERLTVLSEEGKTHLYLPVNGFYQHVTTSMGYMLFFSVPVIFFAGIINIAAIHSTNPFALE